MGTQTIELLAPAQNVACGLAAVNHGADAVYIGGPLFGARAAAANSLADIDQLVRYAHRFRVKVYVTLNTLLEDDELDQAVVLCHRLYELGADALIVQDVGLLESDLPPIPLHASTQMNNRTPAKVRFLEEVGFAQVVLARELSLARIREIRRATTVPLEFFVHGALCVCYSGQCYLSEVMANRSANRGQCAQFCRHSFDLRDNNGVMLAHDRFLLSLKDLDLSQHLAALIDAGIQSFKIEGRLKDVGYVKNVTAAYRLALDALIEARGDLARGSSGRCHFGFVPDPSRSFSRGATDAFLLDRRKEVAEIRTPKSLGKRIGRVAAVETRSFAIEGGEAVHNGDGLCFFDRDAHLVGLRVNRVEGRTVFPRDGAALARMPVGATVFRNLDIAFNKLLEQSDLCRTLAVTLTLRERDDGLQLDLLDEDGIGSTTALVAAKAPATKAGMFAPLARRQLAKTGGTVFAVSAVVLETSSDLFIPAAAFNELRREAFAQHLERRLAAYVRESRRCVPNEYPWPSALVDYRDNITNTRAMAFYRRHGVTRIDPDRLRAGQVAGSALMTTKYCLKAQLGLCPRSKGSKPAPAEPFTLADRTGEYVLAFDCDRCEMTVTKKKGN